MTRRTFLKGGALTTAALSTGVLGAEVGEAHLALEDYPSALKRATVTLKVNGLRHRLEVEPRTTLLEVLREELQLTGTKKGCDRGQCGSCTVLLNGRPVYSCLSLAIEAVGKEILTIEGISDGETLHPVQRAFVQEMGLQCGFCSPGQILATVALLGKNPSPSEAQIRQALAGNLCRCGAYPMIFKSVQTAARLR
ncbi:MAG: (2Fe-2S)-binding protein [Candidatus Tectomicrobia bacterium]|uniref:(2Fe-2S)-binding protein n=1 Tax=Tectimicrobiota bacterium TaxID=2528274 RepID=A0A932GSQ4_UNCTE|nr:(2Fe-2S)-binding protein [Candidatus Tectomicrobia bacterium]